MNQKHLLDLLPVVDKLISSCFPDHDYSLTYRLSNYGQLYIYTALGEEDKPFCSFFISRHDNGNILVSYFLDSYAPEAYYEKKAIHFVYQTLKALK